MQRIVAATALLVLCCLCACSKKDSPSPSGIGIDGGTSGPSNTWLSLIVNAGIPDTSVTEIHFNSDHSVSKVITATVGFPTDSTRDTIYTTIIPVYSGGKLTELQSAPDTLSGSGPAVTVFDYTSTGSLERIRYNPGSNSYAYDSLVTNPSGLLAASYHFVLDSTSGKVLEPYYESFTWTLKNNLQTVLINNIDPSTGSVSSLTASYTYDGFYNPYKTVKDLPFMLGSLDNILPLLSNNNVLTSSLVGFNSENNYTYQYNPNSIPSSQNISEVVQGSVKQSTFVYFQYIQ
jgi:hypothetical protein